MTLSKFLTEGPQILGRGSRKFCIPNIEGSQEAMASKFTSSCKSRFSFVFPLLSGVPLVTAHCLNVCMMRHERKRVVLLIVGTVQIST